MIDYFAKGLENYKQIDCISLDFHRAFDTVPQEKLLLKMRYYGIVKLIPWFRDFLTRKQMVVIDGVKSRLMDMISGIGQGTVISALCFLIFINGLPEPISNSFIGLILASN